MDGSIDDSRADPRADLAADVRAGLGGPGPKRLPPRWFYDDLGSALFEAICSLPEYGLSRAGERLLVRHSAALGAPLEGPLRIVELGGGGGKKLRLVVEGLGRERVAACCAVDVSAAALASVAAEMRTVLPRPVEGILAPFESGLRRAASARAAGERLLVLFLGSNLGNFDPVEARSFLADLRRALRPGDALLLGLDLVKPAGVLLRAYDDALGVTAAFNRNLLVRMNRELGATFDIADFAHEARWDEDARRVEMHLVARCALEVPVPRAGIRAVFARGESIWTESSHKYHPDELEELGAGSGFELRHRWSDPEWAFVHALYEAR